MDASGNCKVLIVSDTHGWDDTSFVKDIQCVPDEIWHAGDIGSLKVTDQYLKIAAPKAVYGNIDGAEIRAEFPEFITFKCCGLKILMIHIGGKPPFYNSRSRKLIQLYRPDVFVCGHSHICKVERDLKNRLLFINPGAIGKHGFHKFRTCILLTIESGRPKAVRVLEYPR